MSDNKYDNEGKFDPNELDDLDNNEVNNSLDEDDHDEEDTSNKQYEADEEIDIDEDEDDEDVEPDSEDEVLEEDKKSNIVKYGIGVLAIGVIGMGGFLAYQKFLAPSPSVSVAPQPQKRVETQPKEQPAVTQNTEKEESQEVAGLKFKEPEKLVAGATPSKEPKFSQTLENANNNSTTGSSINNKEKVVETKSNVGYNRETKDSRYDDIIARLDNMENMIKENKRNIKKNKELNNRLNSVISQVDQMNEAIKKMEKEVQEMSSSMTMVSEIAEEKKVEKMKSEGNIKVNVPKFASGRERMIGYKVVSAAKDPSMVIVESPSGDMIVLAPDSSVNYKGSTLFVEDVDNRGTVVLVGDKYFVDSIKGKGPEATKAKVEKKVEKKAVAKKATVKKKEYRPIPKEQRPEISGWKGVAQMEGGNKIGVDLGDGRFITLVEGEPVKVYGRVQEIGSDGTIYFRTHKISFIK